LHYSVELAYEVRSASADFIFNVQAARTPRQQVLWESLTTSQHVACVEYVDPASAARFLRLRAFAGRFVLRYEASVELHHHLQEPSTVAEIAVADLPGYVLPYLYPSRYCESDKLNAFAMQSFGGLWQGHPRVQAICDWVQHNVAFTSGSSIGTTSATDTLREQRGVCRDFAHLMIALCRALNLPARFTTGLDYGADPALGPTDFHAYVEVYLGGRWYMFDPSGTAIPMGFVRLASGRDAADTAYASIFGDVVPAHRALHIGVQAGQGGVRVEPYRTNLAISSADV
jgi:transglutaminase-like putative cysteine protease